MKLKLTTILIVILYFAGCAPKQKQDNTFPTDIIIYGGTSAGVAAAIQSSRMGKSVILIEPTFRIGGLTSGGLGATDIGKK